MSRTIVLDSLSKSQIAQWFEEGLIDRLLDDLDSAPIEPRLKPILTFVRKLALAPRDMTQVDADAVFSAGWEEKALHDAIAITARMSFMQRLVEGHGFRPLSREVAREHAKKRVKRGHVNLYRAFAKRADH
jgi:uncharacterized protein YciW